MSNDFMFEPALKIISKSDRGLRLLFRYMYFADKIRVYLLSKFHCKSTDHFTYTRCDDVLIQKILQSQGDRFINILNDLGIRTTISNIVRKSDFTRYELQAVSKVEADRIASLINGISRSTLINNESPIKVQIEAHTYGLENVEIEIPIITTNIRLHELVNSKEFLEAESPLTVILGCDDSGKIVSANLSRLPHLLIAGSTGSGKSMCIHSMIMSLLYKSLPDQVRFLMIDPKAVELGIYNGIPQLLAPVVTDPRKAAGALNWAVNEMLKRYQLFADNSVRDLNMYNRLAKEKSYQDADGQPMPALPQIVIIIDELADLMVAAPNNVENAICRLAQMARAAGMHLIIATQKPSADVITDTIKANIPSWIAFAVSSQTDSRTILNIEGAEKLHGHGDMLFSPMGMAKPMRVQGCSVSKLEIEVAVRILKGAHEPFYDPSVLDEIVRSAVRENENAGDDDVDPMLQDAIKCVTEAGWASASFLQRCLRIGYMRAGNLIDKMEDMGIIGPREASKPRKALVTYPQYLDIHHDKNNSFLHPANQTDNSSSSELKSGEISIDTSNLPCVANAQLYFSGKNMQIRSIYEIFRSIYECLDETMLSIFTPFVYDSFRPYGEIVSVTIENIEASITSIESIQIGMGKAVGEDCIKSAVQSALSTPGLENSIQKSPFIIVSFKTPHNLDHINLDHMDEGIRIISEIMPHDSELIWNWRRVDDPLKNEAIVTIFALHSDKDSFKKSEIDYEE